MQDLRLAVRSLRASPVVSIVAALSLALGMGANTAIFSLINSVLIRPLPVDEPQRLVTITSDQAIGLGFKAGAGWNYTMWEGLRPHAGAFDGAFVFSTLRFDLSQSGESQPVNALVASGDFFTTLGVRAAMGRTFTRADDVRGGGPDGPVAVISHRFWQRHFGGASDVIGRPVHIEGAPFTVIGVTPPRFLGLEIGRAFDLAVPLETEPLIRGTQSTVGQRQAFVLIAMLRLKPGQPLAEATATIRTLQPQILGSGRYPKFVQEPFTLAPAATGTSGAEPGVPGLRQRYERTLVVLLLIVALVLLIACANIANLLLARANARRHELTVRLALGASRWRLARQWLAESLVLALPGAAGGILFAGWVTRSLVSQLSTQGNDVVLDLSLDWRVLAFTGAVTVMTAVLFGTAPAWRAARLSMVDTLNAHGRGSVSDRRLAVSGGLVVGQVALSLVLLVAAGLFIQTFAALARVPLGFDSERVLIVTLNTARAQIAPADRLSFYHRVVATLAAVPGLAQAAASSGTPTTGSLPRPVQVPGSSPSDEYLALTNAVTPGWFAAYGTAVRAGRDFDDRDSAASPAVAIVNETLARRFYPGREALGATVDNRTIVGTVSDQVVQGGYKPNGAARTRRDGVMPMVYVPLAQSAGSGPPGRTVVILSLRPVAGSPASMAGSVGAALTGIDPRLTFTFQSLQDAANAPLAQDRIVAVLAGFFGGLALLLAGIGLYGVTAYAVSRRRLEVGIRLALGASPRSVVQLMLVRVALLAGAGMAIGASVSLWLSRFAAPLLYGLPPRDPATLIAAAIVLAVVAATAGWIPARWAARVDPAHVLRE